MGTIFFVILLAIPFHFIWNELAPTYFAFLPQVYQQIPLFDCMGLFTLAAIFRVIFIPSRPIIKKFNWKRQGGFQRSEKYVNR